MDRVIYIAMAGAREVTRQQAAVSHNLANVSTHGFRQELNVFRALPVVGEGAKTRAFVLETTPRTDFTQGVIQQTERPLDVALRGPGWIAVQGADGQEAYTRMGHLQVSQNGMLQTSNGLSVLGDGGPIAVPPDQDILIGRDGTISSVPVGRDLNAVAIAGRIKLTNPSDTDLVRGDDGLFRRNSGQPAPADANVTLVSGALEASNVNPAEALVNMVSLSRQFEMNMRVLRAAQDNENSANKVLSANG
ncbi:MAG: flagellar basal-body rod protein FlgF [Hydrogenophilales bacterium CG17_big_fil_post_rev_8_21_14_2_50_63_12]|nr:MAG: flagellar basal-body rod protein FlgF [Hydrogenophilales bacterium CG17_big_fil_post_rev_8_21_14_2_50_63_12]PIX95882.1 MAG: flagellar basal-body rod protein FlgF [Hydrogenophilales bacterium CG_4_10_14_3_um_filter_63_21]PJB02884.1 MAG: flagellar basal-body rod protein FlgF [Hydrogenophilales bacterium CG_4_9_14_3_um_filter_63_34]